MSQSTNSSDESTASTSLVCSNGSSADHGLGIWTNKRVGDDLIKERLDRVLCTSNWRVLYPTAVVFALPAVGSDHSPLLLDTIGTPGLAFIAYVLWQIWRGRNSFVFRHKQPKSHFVVPDARAQLNSYDRINPRRKKPHSNALYSEFLWQPPDRGAMFILQTFQRTRRFNLRCKPLLLPFGICSRRNSTKLAWKLNLIAGSWWIY